MVPAAVAAASTAALRIRRVCITVLIPCYPCSSVAYASKMRAGVLVLMATIGFIPSQRSGGQGPVPTYGYQVVRSYPHDPGAFTQGLIIRDGVFYEGTGL